MKRRLQPIDYVVCLVSLFLVILILCVYLYNTTIKPHIDATIRYNNAVVSETQAIHTDIIKLSDYVLKNEIIENYLTDGVYDYDYKKSDFIMDTVRDFPISTLAEHIIIHIPEQNVVYSSLEVGKTSKETFVKDFPEYKKIIESSLNGINISSVFSHTNNYTVYSYKNYKNQIMSILIPNQRMRYTVFSRNFPNFYKTLLFNNQDELIVANTENVDFDLIEYSLNQSVDSIKLKSGNIVIKNSQSLYKCITFLEIFDIIKTAFVTDNFFIVVALSILGLLLVVYIYFFIKQKALTVKQEALQSNNNLLSVDIVMQKLFNQNILTQYDKERLFEYFETENISFFVPAVISIVDYHKIHQNSNEAAVFKYGYENIINEVLSQIGTVKTVNMGREFIGVLIYSDNTIEIDDIRFKVDYYYNFIKDKFQVDLFTVIGNSTTNFQDIFQEIPKLIKAQNLKFVKKDSCISITDTKNNDSIVQYPSAIQTKIILAINSKNLEKAEEFLKEFCNYTAYYEYPFAQEWFLKLFLEIIDNCRNNPDIDIKSDIKLENFFNCTTIYEMADIIIETVKYTNGSISKHVENTFHENVIEIIEKEFSNPNFGIQTVIDKLGYNAAYFGQKFKQEFNLTFNRYLLEYRLNYSLHLLMETNYTNATIASLCGFNTENYFITIFKKNLGVTPKEYRTKKNKSE